MITSKKTRVVGTQEYINKNTGEIEEFQVLNFQDRDFNFHKIWLEHIINSLNIIGNQKLKLTFWIIDNLDQNNKLSLTYRQISQKSEIGYQTVTTTMKSLIESNFLKRINQGTYIINPEFIFKGSHKSRINILYQYDQIAPNENENNDEEKENEERS